jgi:hypothetical protein
VEDVLENVHQLGDGFLVQLLAQMLLGDLGDSAVEGGQRLGLLGLALVKTFEEEV